MKTELQAAPSIEPFSTCLSDSGGRPLPSEQAAVPPSTLPGLLSHPESDVRAVVAILLGLLAEGMTSDKLALSMMHGKQIAAAAGVSQAEWEDAVKQVNDLWEARRQRHPYGHLVMF